MQILPISEKHHDYAKDLHLQLQEKDINGFLDGRDEKIGKKIRDAEVKKIPFMLIVGGKEAESNSVSIRQHGKGDLGSMKTDEFIQFFINKVSELVK